MTVLPFPPRVSLSTRRALLNLTERHTPPVTRREETDPETKHRDDEEANRQRCEQTLRRTDTRTQRIARKRDVAKGGT